MSLSLTDIQIAYNVFARYAKREFAVGYYESHASVTQIPNSATTVSMPGTTIYKSTTCKAEVPGLDHDQFIKALDEFLELSRENMFNILADPDTDIGE